MLKTGFSFLDSVHHGISADSLVLIYGMCCQVEEFTVSLMQGILDSNDEGYIFVYNVPSYHLLNQSVFQMTRNQGYLPLLSSRLSTERILDRHSFLPDLRYVKEDVDSLIKQDLSFCPRMKKFAHLHHKKLKGIFITHQYNCRMSLQHLCTVSKKLALDLQVPVFVSAYTEKNIKEADVAIKLEAVNGYKPPITLSLLRNTPSGWIRLCKGTKLVRYAKNLKECRKLWFEDAF